MRPRQGANRSGSVVGCRTRIQTPRSAGPSSSIPVGRISTRAGGDYRVASVDVRNEGEHCQVSYTLEDAGRAVLGCTVEYGEGCPWFGFGWATMPSIGETVWRSGLTEN